MNAGPPDPAVPAESPRGSASAVATAPQSSSEPAGAAGSEPCPNCRAPLFGPFCYACGQPKKGLIRHFGSIIGDFLDTVFNFDSRTFRTLPALLFRPGFLSTEYFAGRRVRYVTPLRLYFFLSIVTFLVIAAVTDVDGARAAAGSGALEEPAEEIRAQILRDIERELDAVPPAERKAERARRLAEIERLGIAGFGRGDAVAAKSPASPRAGESARGGPPGPAAAHAPPKDDARADEDFRITFGNTGPWDPVRNPVTVDWLSDELNAALNAEIGVLVGKVRALRDDPSPFVRELLGNAPQALFLILPLFALLLKLAYLFKRRLYMEHMIVALHSHSFLCLSLLLQIGLMGLTELEHWPLLAALAQALLVALNVWTPLYLLLMQKRVYRQGWIMTVLKFVLVGLCYIVLLTFGLLATMLVSLIFL